MGNLRVYFSGYIHILLFSSDTQSFKLRVYTPGSLGYICCEATRSIKKAVSMYSNFSLIQGIQYYENALCVKLIIKPRATLVLG